MRKTSEKRPLWKCRKCGARFVTKNLWHSCGKFSMEDLFSKSEPNLLRVFKKLARMVRTCGPVTMIPQKTRVVFMVRVRFFGAYPRKSYLLCGIGFRRRYANPRFTKIESYGANFHGHYFKITSQGELDDEVMKWIRESYNTVGSQNRIGSGINLRNPRVSNIT